MKYFVSYVYYKGNDPFPKFGNIILDAEYSNHNSVIKEFIEVGYSNYLNRMIAGDDNFEIIAFNHIKEPE